MCILLELYNTILLWCTGPWTLKIINVHWSSCKIPVLLVRCLKKLEFSRQIFRNILKYQISWKSVQWQLTCSVRTNMRADKRKLSVAFCKFCERAKNAYRTILVFIWRNESSRVSANIAQNTWLIRPAVRTSNLAWIQKLTKPWINPLKPELNPICYLLALLGAHHFLHVSRIRVKLLTLWWLMSYIYGAPILDVSRSHTTTQHSR